MSAEPRLTLIPYGVDPLRALAERLLDRQADALPDLSPHVVLLPRGGASGRFRSILLEMSAARGHEAILPPWIGGLRAWLERYAPAAGYLSDAARELVLLDALQAFPQLQARFGAWPLIDNLLALFDELTLGIGQPPDTLEDFQRLLQAGYGAVASLAPLDVEAERIYMLWSAWNDHLRHARLSDPAWRMRAALARSVEQLPPQTHIFLAGVAELTDSEAAWVRSLYARGQLTVLLHGQVGVPGYHPDRPLAEVFERLDLDPPPGAAADDFGAWVDSAFVLGQAVLPDRARAFAAAHPAPPTADRLKLLAAADLEQEARAIDLQVRRWCIEGRGNVGIVTNDRKLARRVRALLERANVGLRDAAGWALSTTSAATALGRWLECLEQDFAATPLLDLLKSPFVTMNMEPEALVRTVRAFDRHLVRALHVAAGLGDYRAALARGPRTPAAGVEIDRIGDLLDRLARAAAPLRPMLGPGVRAPAAYMDALFSSLEQLGVLATFQSDEAGTELLAALDELYHAHAGRAVRISWGEFHRWLQRGLERRRFRSTLAPAGIELMGLAESRCYRFDGVIIAGCTRDHLPGNTACSPFFNDAVRRHLGLPALEQRLAVAFYDFRRLLEAAPKVLLTYRRADAGETLAPSPWVERIAAFHRLAYGETLTDNHLESLLRLPATLLTRRETPLPAPEPMPAPRLRRSLIPSAISAGALQRLIDCPYQFYAADTLKLVPREDLHAELEKSDYGERIHRVLQAFHVGVAGLPGPWRGPVTAATRRAAESLLREISTAVFASDIARRFSTRGWLYRWEAIIPAYVDWQQQREHSGWHVEAAEIRRQRHTDSGDAAITLTGRIDRIDRSPAGISIIDYKTGRLPDRTAMTAGEHIQLPFYTLLVDEPAAEAVFLGLHHDGIDDSRRLTGDAAASARESLSNRVVRLLGAVQDGTTLHAWGDAGTCRYCAMEGICRKEMWPPSRA